MRRFILSSVKCRKLLAICLLTMTAIMSVGPTQGQDVTRELLVLADGDLWSWHPETEQFTQRTHSGSIQQLTLSPDGTQVAYAEDVSRLFAGTDVILYEGTPPTDIWVLDLTTDETQRIATQPEGLSSAAFRSPLTWSPEGTQLAWVRGHVIIIYDLVSDETTEFSRDVDFGFQDAGIHRLS
jgi:Tol biopolymer transport system component